MIRGILSIPAGYAFFVVASLALSNFPGKIRMGTNHLFLIFSAIFGAVSYFTAGLVATLIAMADICK